MLSGNKDTVVPPNAAWKTYNLWNKNELSNNIKWINESAADDTDHSYPSWGPEFAVKHIFGDNLS